MFVGSLYRTIRDAWFRLFHQWLSAAGVLLTTVSVGLFIILFTVEWLGFQGGPYFGILTFVVLPLIFVAGLIVIPIGMFLRRRHESAEVAAGRPLPTFPIFDFNLPRMRNVAVIVFALTLVNLIVIAAGTYRGLQTLHSDQFCGGACHGVMEPEAVAHERTAHASVACADCHVGAGVGHFVKSKMRGAGQLFQLLAGNVARPVPLPVEVPEENCVHCHNPSRFIDERLHVRKLYSDDEKTEEKTTVWRTPVGGQRDGKWAGIHAHLGKHIRFLTDAKRTVINQVELTRPDGSTDKFVAEEEKPLDGAHWRTMTCVDCHNRPAHRFPSPERLVDGALARGALDKELPFIRREALRTLTAGYTTRDEAKRRIPETFTAFYKKEKPEAFAAKKASLDAAGVFLTEAWLGSNFPGMKVGFGTYPELLGHEPGCFRCHDKAHKNQKGEVIAKKCGGMCHELLATEEESPEIIEVLYP